MEPNESKPQLGEQVYRIRLDALGRAFERLGKEVNAVFKDYIERYHETEHREDDGA